MSSLNSHYLRCKNCISWCRHFSYYFIIRHLSIHSFSRIWTKITIYKHFSTLPYFSINYMNYMNSDIPTLNARNYIASRLHSWWCPTVNSFKFQLCNHTEIPNVKLRYFKVWSELAKKFQSNNKRLSFFFNFRNLISISILEFFLIWRICTNSLNLWLITFWKLNMWRNAFKIKRIVRYVFIYWIKDNI